MPDNVAIRKGKAAMMYVGDEPWHQLGKKLDHPPTSSEAIKAAGLDWDVIKQPLYAGHGRSRRRVWRQYAVVPADCWEIANCPVFGIVGKEYVPLQNSEAFTFFDPVIKEGKATYETAGALGKGERVWILVKMTDDMEINGCDAVQKYLLLFNSHDGHNCVQLKFTPIRVVCQNTLLRALSSGNAVHVAHTRKIAQHLDDAKVLLGLIADEFNSIEQTFQQMATIPMRELEAVHYLSDVFPLPTDPKDEAGRNRIHRLRDTALYFFDQGRGNREVGIGGTLWAAYNGVTEFVDHSLIANRSLSRQVESIWFGDGAQIKLRALRTAERYMKQIVGKN